MKIPDTTKKAAPNKRVKIISRAPKNWQTHHLDKTEKVNFPIEFQRIKS